LRVLFVVPRDGAVLRCGAYYLRCEAWGNATMFLQVLEIIKWPLAAVICIAVALLMLRSPLSTLIGRARRAGFGDKAIIDFLPTSAEQQKALEPPSSTVAVPTVPAAMTLPVPMEIYTPIETEITNGLETSQFPPDVQKAWLIRALAAMRVMRGHEITYRLILGSQIELLLVANSSSLPNMTRTHQIFDAAKAAFPKIYENFSFEPWLHFILNSGLLKIDQIGVEQALRITPLGQDFLHYLVSNNLTTPKAG
jgi:hypothetical protein